MNPIWHSESSVKRFGGTIDLYLPLHEKMDCSKAWISDNRHRVLTHTMFWIKEVMIPIFGSYITTKDGKKVSVKDICEQHILEDFKMKFIPTPQDFIQEMEFKKWMQNGNGVCPSASKLYKTISKEEPSETITIQEEKKEVIINQITSDMILDGLGSRNNDYRKTILD